MARTKIKRLYGHISVIALIALSLLPQIANAQACGNLGVPGFSYFTNNVDIGDVRDDNSNNNKVGEIFQRVGSFDHATLGTFPLTGSVTDFCVSGIPYVINDRESGPSSVLYYLNNLGATISPAGPGPYNFALFGFPFAATLEITPGMPSIVIESMLGQFYEDGATYQKPLGSWACYDAITNDVQICTVFNYTSNPNCGIAQGVYTGNTVFASYGHDDFCGNEGILIYNGTYAAPDNLNGTVVNNLKSALATATSGTTVTWGCGSRTFAQFPLHSTMVESGVIDSCSAVFVDPNSIPAAGANCGRFSNTALYPYGFYSQELLDEANNPLTNAYSTNSNFCGVGSQLIGIPVENGGVWNWTCNNAFLSTSSSCAAAIRTSPSPTCDVLFSPYNNTTATWLLDPGQIDINFCNANTAHPTAAPLTISAIGGGDGSPWTWTCGGRYYNDVVCTSTSYGKCGSDNGTAIFNFNTGSNTLCANGTVRNVTTGASQDPSYPFTINWTCRGSTSDGSSDQLCNAFAQPAACGNAHMADHQSLLSTSANLCQFGQVLNFGTRAPLDPSNQIEYVWTCRGGDPTGLLDTQCEAYKPAAPTAGLCNVITNGNNFTYDAARVYLQCTQGTPSAPLLANPLNDQWTYSCLGINGGTDAQCTINEVTNAQCTPYSTTVTTQPSVLCNAGTATTPAISNGSWVYSCQGGNGGTSQQCSVACTNGQCDNATPSCNPLGTGANACTDGIQPELNVGQICNDYDGCLCGTNVILNGSTCAAFIPTFPGKLADLRISSHVAHSGSVLRGELTTFTITYQNNGPDTATGTVLEYVYSELLEDLSSTSLFTMSGFTQSGSSTVVYDRMLFYVGNVAAGQSGSIVITGLVKELLAGSDITNNAQVYSLVQDPNPLNNPRSVSVRITDDLAQLNGYLPNPLLVMKSFIDRYDMIMDWVNPDLIYKDIFPGDNEFMHIMTVTKADIMVGYKTKNARYFGREKCLGRAESLIVAAKMMHLKGDDDVYAGMYATTSFADANYNIHITHFINWAYRRGLTDVFGITNKNGKMYLEPDRHVTHKELKEIFNKLYRITNQDTSVLQPLLTEKEGCVTRGETARTIAHLLRGNPQVIMGYNDDFLEALYGKLKPLSIKERRNMINRVVFLLNEKSADRWHKLGLDPETLVGILGSALRGQMYNYDYNTSSVDQFFFEVGDDEYDQYLQDIMSGEY